MVQDTHTLFYVKCCTTPIAAAAAGRIVAVVAVARWTATAREEAVTPTRDPVAGKVGL